MDILIIAATEFEIKPSLRFLKKLGARILITGIGTASTMYAVTKAIHTKRPDIMIQAGVAGCFDDNYKLGTVLAVSQDAFGDLGVMEKREWKTVFDMGFAEANRAPFKIGKLPNLNKKILKAAQMPIVAATTVNEVSTNKTRIQLLKDSGAVLESMEGAALHYVGIMEKVPFLQLRAISNYVGVRDKAKWNFKDAISNLNDELMHFITNYSLKEAGSSAGN